MATVKELLTNVANSTRKFLGTESQLSLEEMSQGIGEASAESDFQTELIAEFDELLSGAVGPDQCTAGRDVGVADTLSKRTDLVVTENGEYVPEGECTGFKKVNVNVLDTFAKFVENGNKTEITADDLAKCSKIGNYAFQGYQPLQSMTVPPNVKEIGTNAFQNCTHLANVTLSEGIEKIGNNAFNTCSLQQHLSLPKSLLEIGSYAFANTGITSALVPGSLGSVPASIFSSCNSLTEVTIGYGITALSNGFIYNCSKLKTLSIPNSVTAFSAGAFNSSGIESLEIPSSVTTIGSSCFRYCEYLKSIHIPSTVSSFDSTQAFERCSALTNVTFGEGVLKSLGNSMFRYCSSLKSIEIPASVTNVSSYALANCTALETVIVKATKPPALASNAFLSSTNIVEYLVPIGTGDAYKSASSWSSRADKIKEDARAGNVNNI